MNMLPVHAFHVWTCCQFIFSMYEPAARPCIPCINLLPVHAFRVWTCCQFMHSAHEPAASSCIPCMNLLPFRVWTCCQFMHSVYEPAAKSCIPCMNLLPVHAFPVWTCCQFIFSMYEPAASSYKEFSVMHDFFVSILLFPELYEARWQHCRKLDIRLSTVLPLGKVQNTIIFPGLDFASTRDKKYIYSKIKNTPSIEQSWYHMKK